MIATPSPARLAWRRLPWPLPALLAWACAWAAWLLLRLAGAGPASCLAAGLATGGLLALGCQGRWRRVLAGGGFPLSALALGAAHGMPPWLWLLLLLPVLALYPLRAWQDAPLFPTPHDALAGLDRLVGTPASVLDAGCGLGHGLAALRRLWPRAQVHGVEWSPLLALLTRLRHRHARVRRGDMWAASWAGHDLVYVFQRPESMARAHAKAAQELAPHAFLVSLEFAVPGVVPFASLQGPGRKPVWIYRPASTAGPGGR